jgi:hypothetical protein
MSLETVSLLFQQAVLLLQQFLGTVSLLFPIFSETVSLSRFQKVLVVLLPLFTQFLVVSETPRGGVHQPPWPPPKRSASAYLFLVDI